MFRLVPFRLYRLPVNLDAYRLGRHEMAQI